MPAAKKLDLYKEHKAEYVTPKKPVLIDVKPAKYLTITLAHFWQKGMSVLPLGLWFPRCEVCGNQRIMLKNCGKYLFGPLTLYLTDCFFVRGKALRVSHRSSLHHQNDFPRRAYDLRTVHEIWLTSIIGVKVTA